MKYIAVVILIFSLPCFAVEYNVGIDGAVGIGISRWQVDVINSVGEYITDHLDSKEPIYQAGLAISVWLTETFGIQTGLQYGWYNYNYSYESAVSTLVSEWKYNNLLVPIHLTYGIPVAGNRLVIGAGFSICRQLSGMPLGPELYASVPDSLLGTTVGPVALVGYEIHTRNMWVFPSFRYVYGIDGLSDRLVESGTIRYKHYLMLGVGLFYNL